MPSIVRGTENNSSTPSSEPKNKPPLSRAIASDEISSTGPATNGTSPTPNAAIAMMWNSVDSRGRRSATTPPIP